MPQRLIDRLRTASALVLFAFVLCHFLNHALGLVSLRVMNAGLDVFRLVWGNAAAGILLTAALLVHVGMAMVAVYRRRTFRMRPWEAAQLLLGLLIPVLLIEHLLGTLFAQRIFEVRVDYAYVQTIYWLVKPVSGVLQAVLLLVVWVHGCIGLHYWLRLKPWYAATVRYLYTLAVLVPALALAGFASSGTELLRRAAAIEGLTGEILERAMASSEAAIFVGQGTLIVRWGFVALLAAVLAARWLPALLRRVVGAPRLAYPDGRVVDLRPGATVLEASRAAGIPHASVCGGRGRCSTCRVRVGAGSEHLPEPSAEERKVLRRVGAAPDVRLACQIRPARDLAVTPLLPVAAGVREAFGGAAYLSGQESEIAILFADLRGFTQFSDARLPYDVVFVLNRYFALMGRAVEQAGGRVDKFIGDGVMALFGVDEGAAEGCRQALAAAAGMARHLEELNRSLGDDLPAPLRMGIGIHVGPVIVGEMGYGRAKSLTAIGDTVNIASRLEGLTKEFGARLVVSDAVLRHAEADAAGFEQRATEVRGKKDGMTVWVAGVGGAAGG